MTLIRLLDKASIETGLHRDLLASVIHQESKGHTYAIRYEPAFYTKYISGKKKEALGGYWPKLCTEKTESLSRAYSYGLMQIMGQVARERGFKGEFLTELCDPAINIDIGAKFLKHLIDIAGDTEKGLLRWNGGGNPNYGKEVLAHLETGDFQYLYI